jgi:23S rRNA (uracil1939-C5)-methyltransferase
MGDQAVIEIEKMVYGGDGLGHLEDGRAVFVPFVMPGEKALVNLTEVSGRFARAELQELLSASAQRVTPPCPHFGVCGGCHYQHMSATAQAQTKLEILGDQLQRIAHLVNPPLRGIVSGKQQFHYRNQLQFHPGPDGSLAFMDLRGSQPVKIQECLLGMAGISEIWPQIDLGQGLELKRVILREDSFGEVMLILEDDGFEAPELEVDLPISVAYQGADGRALTLAGTDRLSYLIEGREFTVSPESFFQVNLEIASALVQRVLQLTAPTSPSRVVELYSGVGLFSAFLAGTAGALTAIESSPSACFDFALNLEAFENVSLYEGAVERILPALVPELHQPDLVVLDPPRAGLHPAAREALLKLQPAAIAYVSCDPSTLARDLKAITGSGYELASVEVFDMFPQTYHLESLSYLQRK